MPRRLFRLTSVQRLPASTRSYERSARAACQSQPTPVLRHRAGHMHCREVEVERDRQPIVGEFDPYVVAGHPHFHADAQIAAAACMFEDIVTTSAAAMATSVRMDSTLRRDPPRRHQGSAESRRGNPGRPRASRAAVPGFQPASQNGLPTDVPTERSRLGAALYRRPSNRSRRMVQSTWKPSRIMLRFVSPWYRSYS